MLGASSCEGIVTETGRVDERSASAPASSDRVIAPRFAAGSTLCPTRIDWATLLKRTYDFDVLRCSYGGRFKVLELATDAGRVRDLLKQFEMSTESPPVAWARSPDWD